MSLSKSARKTNVEPVLISVVEFGLLADVGRTMAYELLKLDGAPQPITIGAKTVRYRYDEAVKFLQSLPSTNKRTEPENLVHSRVG
jgi:predicted DNA-binding transcriptional regulator AlpA